jgi:hypothetical protein
MKLSDLKNRMMTGWGLMRVVRLVLALILIVQAFTNSEFLFVVLGTVLLFQAVFDYGCCGTGKCDINHTTYKPRSSGTADELTTFEEVK